MEVKAECMDKNCPVHGTLSVRGRTFEGRVVSDKMQHTVVVELEHMRKMEKYERYERRTSRHAAHNPPCINARAGDRVEIAECRRLSKTVSFVVMRKLEG